MRLFISNNVRVIGPLCQFHAKIAGVTVDIIGWDKEVLGLRAANSSLVTCQLPLPGVADERVQAVPISEKDRDEPADYVELVKTSSLSDIFAV